MSSSMQTVCRTLRGSVTSQSNRLGANQLRQLSTLHSDGSNDRTGAVRDAIMDKLWVSQVYPPVEAKKRASTVAAATVSSNVVFGSRDPPLGTAAFDPSLAPRWSGPSASAN